MTLTTLPFALERTIVIHARPETIFSFFTDSERWAKWWGAGSHIEPRKGGAVLIRYPNAVEAAGEVIEITPPTRLVFTYGYANGQPIAAGASRVTITLAPIDRGTRLTLHHAFADKAVREMHEAGWRYQLALFANAVSDALHAGAAAHIDAWFRLWGESDAASREAQLPAFVAEGLVFRDRFSLIEGRAELSPHIAASQRFMPGVALVREGAVRQCQGTVLADWRASGADGRAQPRRD